jgi:hypothetical protein
MQATGKTPPQRQVLIKRSVAAQMAGWSLATLKRRERLDPRIPVKIAVGMTGGQPYAYRYDEWISYLAGFPASPASPTPDPDRSLTQAEVARQAAAARRAARDAAEGRGDALPGKNAPAAQNAPSIRPLPRGKGRR